MPALREAFPFVRAGEPSLFEVLEGPFPRGRAFSFEMLHGQLGVWEDEGFRPGAESGHHERGAGGAVEIQRGQLGRFDLVGPSASESGTFLPPASSLGPTLFFRVELLIRVVRTRCAMGTGPGQRRPNPMRGA